MADAGLFIGWGEVVRGREAEAVETFNSTMEYFGGLQADGTIESIEPVFLEPHGGDLQGFFFLRGEAEKLATLRVDDEFRRRSSAPVSSWTTWAWWVPAWVRGSSASWARTRTRSPSRVNQQG